MELESGDISDLDRLVKAVTAVDGVVAVILFGSRSRGDYDEHSDYDVMVVFSSDEVMWKNRRKLYENVGKLGLFTQVLTRSIRELNEKTEPTFLQSMLEQGTILYLRYPFKAPALAQNLSPMTIVTYSLTRLPHNEKMKVNYRLFGKESRGGIVGQSGGSKLGDRCFIIPTENLEKATRILELFDVKFEAIKVYASPQLAPVLFRS